MEAQHPGFEETAYLLLFGELPTNSELKDFREMLAERRMLPPNFVRDVIMKAPSRYDERHFQMYSATYILMI